MDDVNALLTAAGIAATVDAVDARDCVVHVAQDGVDPAAFAAVDAHAIHAAVTRALAGVAAPVDPFDAVGRGTGAVYACRFRVAHDDDTFAAAASPHTDDHDGHADTAVPHD